VAVVQCTFTHKQYIEQDKHKQYIEITNNNRTAQITANLEEWGPCPIFASLTPAFALQLRGKKNRKNLSQGTRRVTVYILRITKTPIHYKTTHIHAHTLQNPHIHTHILQNNIKPSQYKLKQTQFKIYPNKIVTIQTSTLSVKSL